jgi:hypothetical protein
VNSQPDCTVLSREPHEGHTENTSFAGYSVPQEHRIPAGTLFKTMQVGGLGKTELQDVCRYAGKRSQRHVHLRKRAGRLNRRADGRQHPFGNGKFVHGITPFHSSSVNGPGP